MRIILITGWFPKYDSWGTKNGEEFVASHGIDEMGNSVIVQCEHPRNLGAKFDPTLNEWVLEE